MEKIWKIKIQQKKNFKNNLFRTINKRNKVIKFYT